MKAILRLLLRGCYRFRCFNTASLSTPGPVLLLANHVSWWDWLLVAVCLEDDWRFVVPSPRAGGWIFRRLLARRTLPVDLNSPFAVKRITEYLDHGGRLVWFPEGRLSRTGSLMKFFDGTGLLLSRTPAKVILAHIRGAGRLPFSPNPSRKQWFPRLSIHFGEVLALPEAQGRNATETRAQLSDWLRDQMIRHQFEIDFNFSPPTVPSAIRAAAGNGFPKPLLQDSSLRAMSYRQLLVGAEVLSRYWRRTLAGLRVGILLPNVNVLPLTLLGVWAAGKIPAILNYTLGPASVLTCARLAGVTQIITSKAFLQHLKFDPGPFRAAGVELIFLEDARKRIPGLSKLWSAAAAFFRKPRVEGTWQPSDTAVILFTSGSEGEPKGVELSHRNLLANIYQMLSVIDLLESDRFFNALPLFHSFGLTVGLLLPLVRGVFVFLYVSPLHFRVVPSAFYNLDCTVLFGTNTFLAGYARKAHPYDFHQLRYVFAGAEKLQETTFNVWMRKFGVRILEGYGATECSPCVSVNVPSHPKPGSVGQFLPGIDYKLEPVEGLEAQNGSPGHGKVGRLFVRGPNVMRGYLNKDANADFRSLGGWYDTGDVMRVDSSGTLFVLGRLKRFAKISGEMISLAAVEDALTAGLVHYGLKFGVAVLTRPDETRGEKLIAITNEPRLTLEAMRETLRARGFSNLAVPREIRLVEELPRLGTGKINLQELERMVSA